MGTILRSISVNVFQGKFRTLVIPRISPSETKDKEPPSRSPVGRVPTPENRRGHTEDDHISPGH